ncbi:class F sortase [Streptacidiphilus sp. MAP5-3]|uniref:class F sortase n=1 Tax=unclassified Streptacidiphilus TaxID=2643834 RepID=UPI003510E5F7
MAAQLRQYGVRGAVAALVAAAALVLAGCGSGSSGSVAGSTPSDPGGSTMASSTAPAAAAPLARSVPARLRIPAIGVDASVMQVGLNSDGTVGVPPIEANAPAAWYDGSPTPGQTGPSVILGHVTVGSYGDGVFLHLSRLHPGDQVEVTLQDGATAVFRVDSVQTVGKSTFPTNAVYGNVDHPALRLITCGGPHLSGGGYPDNVIVYASLSGS